MRHLNGDEGGLASVGRVAWMQEWETRCREFTMPSQLCHQSWQDERQNIFKAK